MSIPSLDQPLQITLRHDINFLLFQFNKLDIDDTGHISKQDLTELFNQLKVAPQQKNNQSIHQLAYEDNPNVQESTFNLKSHNFYVSAQNYLEGYPLYRNHQLFQFQMLLSLLGNIEHPNEPALYVLSFVKILAGYRNKCLQKDQSPKLIKNNYNSTKDTQQADQSLRQAQQIDEKIRKIIKKQLQRQKQRMLHQHKKIYQQMQKSQINQYHNFEEDWKTYLEQFQTQTHQKLRKTRYNKLKQLSFQSQKMIKTARRNSLTTSPKLQELLDKKKWLVKQGRYSDAIRINHMIDSEKKKIQEHHQNSLDFTLRKRIQSLKKKNQNALSYIQSQHKTNMGRLISKKKEGENLMRIKMKNLQEQAHRKLNDHLRSQLSRLRGAFSRAAR